MGFGTEGGDGTLGGAFASAMPRLAAQGMPEGADLLGRHAMASALQAGSLAGLAPPDTWGPNELSHAVERFAEDLGHAFDAEGASYTDALAEALGAPVSFLDPDGGGDAGPSPVAAWPDPDAPARVLPALEVAYGPEAGAATHGARALRAVVRLAEEIGLDVEDALAWGLSGWAGTRGGEERLAVPGRPPTP